MRFYRFEPFVQLSKATASGSQVTKLQMMAYTQACDYYGEDRVALQKDNVQVDGTSGINKADILAQQDLQCSYVQSVFTEKLSDISDLLVCKLSLYKLFIHWPELDVTNEQDQSIHIKDLFARIPLSRYGLTFDESEKFTFMRTTYSKNQWNRGYMHSHVNGLNRTALQFKHVCLGSGPILRTIETLKTQPYNVEATMLFFWELDKVAHVESLSGVPYIRLTSIVSDRYEKVDAFPNESCLNFFKQRRATIAQTPLHDFILSFLKAVETPLSFVDGKYVLGCSFTDFAVSVSNYYTIWFNTVKEMAERGIIKYLPPIMAKETYLLKDGDLYMIQGSIENRAEPRGVRPFKFNDTEFQLTVEKDDTNKNYMTCKLLPLSFIASLLNFILTSVNTATSFEYEEIKEENPVGDNSSAFVSRDTTKRRVYAKTTNRTPTAY